MGPNENLFTPSLVLVAPANSKICSANKSTWYGLYLSCTQVNQPTLSYRYSPIPSIYVIKQGIWVTSSTIKELLQKDFPCTGISLDPNSVQNTLAFKQRVIYFKWDYLHSSKHWFQYFPMIDLKFKSINNNQQ